MRLAEAVAYPLRIKCVQRVWQELQGLHDTLSRRQHPFAKVKHISSQVAENFAEYIVSLERHMHLS
jgi:hypothetical protein